MNEKKKDPSHTGTGLTGSFIHELMCHFTRSTGKHVTLHKTHCWKQGHNQHCVVYPFSG